MEKDEELKVDTALDVLRKLKKKWYLDNKDVHGRPFTRGNVCDDDIFQIQKAINALEMIP